MNEDELRRQMLPVLKQAKEAGAKPAKPARPDNVRDDENPFASIRL